MVTVPSAVLQLTPPAGWLFVAGDSAENHLADLVSDGVADPVRRDRLRDDAQRVLAMKRAPSTRGVAAVHPDVDLRDRVIAAGTLSLGPVVDFEDLSRTVESAPRNPGVLVRQVDVWGRRISAVWVRHEMYASDQGLLHERCVVVRNLAGFSAKLTVSTSDLESFSDLAATCARVIRSLSVQELSQ